MKYFWIEKWLKCFDQNERPPLPASCDPAVAHLIKHCWSANPSKRPDFSYIVSTLEKYDECLKEGLPMSHHHSGLVTRNVIVERLKGCVSLSSSIPVYAWFTLTSSTVGCYTESINSYQIQKIKKFTSFLN